MEKLFDSLSVGSIVHIILFFIAAAALLTVFLVLRHKIRTFFGNLRKDKERLESLKIDSIRTDVFTCADAHTWFDGYLKNGRRGLLMTAEALKAKDNDILVPSCPSGSSVYYLAVYSPDKDETLRQRFIVAGHTEPDLARLIEENAGTVVFEA